MTKRLYMAGFAVYTFIEGLMIFESWRDRVPNMLFKVFVFEAIQRQIEIHTL